MNGREYQKLAARTINQKLSGADKMCHALYGITGEVGEIHSMFQKTYQGHEMNKGHLKKEFGDLLWFIAEFCTSVGWNLDDIMQMNIDKLKTRYPEGFSEEASIHRKE